MNEPIDENSVSKENDSNEESSKDNTDFNK